jgi:hypothetical protein
MGQQWATSVWHKTHPIDCSRKPGAHGAGFLVDGKVKIRANSLYKSEKGNLVMTPRTTSEMLTGR